ncbi:MAG: hypothetical protein AAGB04_25880, partial [Pseudomonadota bacterium]
MTREEQASATAKQAEIDSVRRAQWEAEQKLRQDEARARQLAREEAVAAIYERPRYGDILEVSVEGGGIAFNGRRETYEPLGFLIARGEVKPVTFLREGRHLSTSTVWMYYDGLTFYFDVGEDFDAESKRSRHERLVFVGSGAWDRGETIRPT